MSNSVQNTISRLVDNFSLHLEHYKSTEYNETEARREFLDPFFKALGWDIDNEKGYADAYKDVIHEDTLQIGGTTKSPDYSFRIGGQRKFFLEAKKPQVKIKTEIDPAYQLRRYGWSAKLPLSILSNFNEFAVYDCRVRPTQNDPSSKARILYFSFDQYVEKWGEIESIFSRESILKGSFDKFAESSRKKHGTAEVDAAFLSEIEHWREKMAQNFALRNPELSVRDLNFAVQKTIDRIIFLRICEDRGSEDYGNLQNLLKEQNIYSGLFELFRKADARYNSGLFHFSIEADRPSPDTLTPSLSLDDKVLKEILKHLYYPDSPYEFSVLPADILGHVYEQFLGKTIRLTAAHHAKIDEKPEVRKAGGVYYTPKYIVDYIVKNTLGKLLNGENPEQVKPIRVSQAETLKVLDPACGSGSFLIEAYQLLMDWHRDQYTLNPLTGKTDPGKMRRHAGGKNPKIYQASDGEYRLTTTERKRILLNNIYGVDIDSQAVEVTKLSLLLKVLEGETGQVKQKDWLAERERILPDLGKNIQCGNSLIGPDFYDQPNLPQLDEETEFRINVFDWKSAFPDILKSGGFDCVVGNPPYLRIQGLQKNYGHQIEYFIGHFNCAIKRFDFYMLFLEKGNWLLKKDGVLGFICPHKFLNGDFASGLRRFLSDNRVVSQILSFGQNLIFEAASTYTCIITLNKATQDHLEFCELSPRPTNEFAKDIMQPLNFTSYSYETLGQSPWSFFNPDVLGIMKKLKIHGIPLTSKFYSIFQGVVTGIDEIYFLTPVSETSNTYFLTSHRCHEPVEIEKKLLIPMLKGENIHRYTQPKSKLFCIYPYLLTGGKTKIYEESALKKLYPLGYAYLCRYREELIKLRMKYKTNPKYWYSCHRGRKIEDFECQRIITPEISLGCNMTLSATDTYHNTKVYSFIPQNDSQESIKYWLGILNSSIMWWFLSNTGYVLRGGYFCFKTNYLRPFPICPIDFTNPEDVFKHDRMVEWVETMLDLNKRKAEEKNPETLRYLERKIEITDGQIDRLVYELYGLSDEEIELVEQ